MKKGTKVKCDSLGGDEKEQVRKNDKKRKMDKRLQTLDERSSIFDNVQMCSMTDSCILTTPAFRLIEQNFKGAIQEGPTYICDICWKFEFRRNVVKLKNQSIKPTFIMNILLVNQIGFVKVVAILCGKVKCQCRLK